METFRLFIALLVFGCGALMNKSFAQSYKIADEISYFDATDEDLPEGVIILQPGEAVPRHEDDPVDSDDEDLAYEDNDGDDS